MALAPDEQRQRIIDSVVRVAIQMGHAVSDWNDTAGGYETLTCRREDCSASAEVQPAPSGGATLRNYGLNKPCPGAKS